MSDIEYLRRYLADPLNIETLSEPILLSESKETIDEKVEIESK